jgi:hypothetical protein
MTISELDGRSLLRPDVGLGRGVVEYDLSLPLSRDD